MQTFHVPFAFAAIPQEPVNIPEKPAGAAPGPQGTPGTSGGTGTTGTPPGPQPAPQQPCGTEMYIMLPAMLLIMYFLVMRPEQKRRKEQQALLASIKAGDRVVTVGGMHGVVTKLTDRTVTLRIDTTQAVFDRVAIARIERDDATTPPAKA